MYAADELWSHGAGERPPDDVTTGTDARSSQARSADGDYSYVQNGSVIDLPPGNRRGHDSEDEQLQSGWW